jgi:hypothetical protein
MLPLLEFPRVPERAAETDRTDYFVNRYECDDEGFQ